MRPVHLLGALLMLLVSPIRSMDGELTVATGLALVAVGGAVFLVMLAAQEQSQFREHRG